MHRAEVSVIIVTGPNVLLLPNTMGDAKKSYLLMGFCAFFIYFFFIVLGVLFYDFYQGKEFENSNTIILQFAADYGLPGLMGVIAAAVMAASMSSLDSSFNSLSTVATIDFYRKYFKKDASEAHYLKASRFFTLLFAVLIIFPAIGYHLYSEGSILEILSKVGSYFVGAQMGMFFLGFFSKQATENGLIVGTISGFIVVTLVALNTDIAWPWYCIIGASANIVVSIVASRLIDGVQHDYNAYTIKGQQAYFAREGLNEKEQGWYRVPGRIDPINYILFGFFILTIVFLFSIQFMF